LLKRLTSKHVSGSPDAAQATAPLSAESPLRLLARVIVNSGSFVSSLLLPARREWQVDGFGLDRRFFQDFYEPFLSLLYDHYFRVRVEGAEHLDQPGAFVIAANHSGGLPWDAMMFKLAVYRTHPRHLVPRGMAERLVATYPFIGLAAWRVGEVLGDRENAHELLRRGEIVYVFPEGVRGLGKYYRQRYRPVPFGQGFFTLALEEGVPIVPAAIFGAEETHPILFKSRFLARLTGLPYVPFTVQMPWLGLLGLLPIPSRMTIRFLPPLHLDDSTRRAILADKERTREGADSVRLAIREALAAMLRQRKTILGG
jgi:1-acyl-sn-glycerol-3-phosphate acyltransferase